MKAKIFKNSDGSVTREYEGGMETYYVATVEGAGYVRKNSGHQVCQGLLSKGATLRSSKNNLLFSIRREHGKWMKQNKRG